ncbi:MAG: ammonium transporter, partial [Dehalococcoidia bacterium]
MTAGGGLALVLGVSVASAQTPDEALTDLAGALDLGWLLIAGILVLFMQAGFAMVEAGFVRTKNVTNILMKNVLDACFGGLVYFSIGWGLAYGASEAANGFMGAGNWFLSGFTDYGSWFFQFAFAATAATIVSGAMAERTKFAAYLIYTICITGVVYPIVTHWIWDGNGFLTAFTDAPMLGVGMVDFAGSTVVHSVGGWAALVGAIVVGARRGRFANNRVGALPGHSLPLGVLGVFILWVGWYGFNPGSTLGLSGGLAEIAARVAVTTTLAAAAGGATAMLVSWMRYGKSDLSLTLNGVLGGLVAITAGCATLAPWAAVVAGIVAGVIIVYGVMLLDALKIDDPVGAVPVHLMNG